MILIIGESCIDVYVYTKSDRLSPEAPVPVVIPIKEVKTGGMALNVYNNVKNISKNIETKLITNSTQITKTRYVDYKSNHSFIRVDVGEGKIDGFVDVDDIDKYDVTIISDYNKGFLTDKDIVSICNQSKISILDSKRKLTKDIINAVDYIKLNEYEYKNNIDLTNKDNLHKFIITMGGNGAMHNNVIYEQEENAPTIDVSGAGDTFTATLGVMLYKKIPLPEAIKMANINSYNVVLKRGTSLPF